MTERTILYCWEYGGGLGHITSLSAVAEHLQYLDAKHILINRAGATVPAHLNAFGEIVIFPNAIELLNEEDISIENIVSYNATLKSLGYCKPDFLFTRYSLWQNLFEDRKPTVVVGDYAPSAITVARMKGIPTVATGNGYTLPPVSLTSYPRFFDHKDTVAEKELLNSVNQALGIARLGHIDSIPEVFSADVHACFTEPQLDPFARMRNPKAIGPVFKKQPPRFITDRGKGVFIYLTRCSPDIRHLVIEAAEKLDLPVDVFALGMTDDSQLKRKTSNVNILSAPLSLEQICSNYQLVTHLGSHNLAMELLYAGMPQLLLPIDMEKLLYAQALVNNGFANQCRLDHPQSVNVLAEKFLQSLEDQSMKHVLESFSKRKSEADHRANLDIVSDQVEAMLKL